MNVTKTGFGPYKRVVVEDDSFRTDSRYVTAVKAMHIVMTGSYGLRQTITGIGLWQLATGSVDGICAGLDEVPEDQQRTWWLRSKKHPAIALTRFKGDATDER